MILVANSAATMATTSANTIICAADHLWFESISAGGSSQQAATPARVNHEPRAMRHGFEPPALSHRSREILRLVAAGRTNGEIAAELYLSKSTVVELGMRLDL